MPELPSRAKVEVSFQELQENYEGHDIGLEMFDAKLRQLSDNANDDGGSFSDLVDPGVEMLNEEWLYHDDTATVSGRLFVIDGSVIAELADRFGEPDKDEQGNTSFFVEDLELCSYGIADGPHGAPLGDEAVEAKIGYSFVLPDADTPTAQLILYPGEASKHIYPLPTPLALDAKLHSMWPDKMKLVDRLLAADDTKIVDLPRRLALIARKLQNELKDSSDGREWLSVHVNEQLQLDKIWPYVVTVKDTLYFLDDDTSQDWLEMLIDGQTRLDVRKPRIEFIRNDSDGVVQALIFAELPDSRDEWESTPVGMKAADIVHIRGTRAHRSIVDRALAGYEQNIAAALAAGLYEDDELIDTAPAVRIKPTRQEHHGGLPTNIQEMMMLRNELEATISVLQPLTEKRYDSYEQAAQVSHALTNTIASRLIGAGITNFALRFDGELALRALTVKDGPNVQLGQVIVQVDPDKPFAKLEHGDTFDGTFHAFHGDVVTIDGEDGEPAHYRAYPRVVVDTKTASASAMDYGPIRMIEVLTQQRALAPLDGSVRITIPSLVRYEADLEARKAVAQALPRGHNMTHKVNRLYAAFHGEKDDIYQDLRRLDDIRAISRYIESRAEGSTQLLEALSALFLKRSIKTKGVVGESSEDAIRFVDGIVADVTMKLASTDEPGPYLTILDRQTGEYISLRASSLEALAF